jgi:hypothetical protein
MSKKRGMASPRAIDPIRKVAKMLTAPKLAAGKGSPRQIADAALKRLASKLKIDPRLTDLKYEKVRETVLGKPVTYQQVLAHHFLLTPEATFEDGANALLTADTQLNACQNQNTIQEVFVRRGILPNPKRKNRRSGQPFAETSPRHSGKP